MNATEQRPGQAGTKPTIVLVHGAFADASSWNGVIRLLQQEGYTVVAPANPLRGVAADAAYTASLLGQIDGPVLLAGPGRSRWSSRSTPRCCARLSPLTCPRRPPR